VTKAFFRGYKWFALHGLNIREVLTDNGSEFTAYTSRHARDTHFFETMLKIVDIKHRYTKPYRPQTNGKIKRFWKILNNECIRWQIKSQTEKEFIAELNGYMYRYNHQRRHSALKSQTPVVQQNRCKNPWQSKKTYDSRYKYQNRIIFLSRDANNTAKKSSNARNEPG
jgi:transposase InsO family protein